MANHSLIPLTPLGADHPTRDEIGAIVISEVADITLASLAMRRGQDKPFAAAVKSVFKTPLPQAGQSAVKGDFMVLWTSRDQWFVEAAQVRHEDIAGMLKSVFGEAASITEQTGGWARFDVEGDASVQLLQRLCAVDTQTMNTGAATRTVIEHIGVLMVCRSAMQHFSLYGPRSSAGSLHHALVAAARSIA